jgi:hypothetical protein
VGTQYGGDGLSALCGPAMVVLVAAPASGELVTALWPHVTSGDLTAALTVLVSEGMHAVPDFGIAQQRPDGGVTLLVRGSVRAEVRPSGQTIRAQGLTTWAECHVPGVRAFSLSAGPAGTAELPLLGGIVAASRVERTLDGPALSPELGPSRAAFLHEFPAVAAIRCPARHLNPPSGVTCRECSLPLDADQLPALVAQPVVGRLRRLDTGEEWPLGKPLTVLGRSPVGGMDILLIRLTGVSNEVFTEHAEIRLTGWRTEVADRSGAATLVTNPGGVPVRLEHGKPVELLLGGRITLGGEVTFEFLP